MKRISLALLAASAAVLLAGLGISYARPDLVPAWARIRSSPTPADAGLYCQEHGVPEKFCTLCHEELKKSLMLCKEHGGIPEDICTLCHPEVKEKHNIEVCQEHGLPAHFCSRCSPGPSASLDQPDDGWCAPHDKPEALCEPCVAERTNRAASPATTEAVKACRAPLPTVRLASAALARQIGIQTATVLEEEHAHRLVANAETAYDANRYAEISPRVAGFLRAIHVDLGKRVRLGDVLAVVDSSEVSAAKSQFLSAQAAVQLARVTYDRTRSLAKSGSIASKSELEALTSLNQSQASAMDAEQKLRNLGFDDGELKRILEAKDTRSSLNIITPIDGTVVLRHAVKGEAVLPTSQLFAVADTSEMWLWIDVYESDVGKVEPGQAVRFTVSGADPSEAAPAGRGQVTWIGTEVNDRTRTTRVRAELANPQGRFRAHQFGQAEIRVGSPHKAIVVPKAAVQRKDRVDVVFLPESEGVYRPQRVVTKPADRGDVVEVTWGLKPGQRVVTRGAFLLKTEIMKGAIGAGCCD